MNAFLRKFRLRHPFNILIGFFLFTPGVVMADYAQEEVVSISVKSDKIGRNIRMVKLYTVQDGKNQHLILGPEDLRKRQSIEVKGYVTGVLILSDSEMKMSVNGEEMSKIGRNGDGTYTIKHFGKVGPAEIEASSFANCRDTEKRGLPKGYSFFPKVKGDSVSAQESFRIELKTDEGFYALQVKQTPYCTLRPEQAEVVKSGKSFEFQYLGCRLPDHKKIEDFDRRLDAISEGVRSVEKTFEMKLVDRVRIIDYEKVQNAVTCEEKNDIWFYIRTFLEESLEELKIIAQHETLHILVDRVGFAKNSAVRELFADLKGYETLSQERDALMTRGFTSPDLVPGKVFTEFFAFIDERNFIGGMKGGHSSSNMDEFSTSFLHSLMYIDRLYQNFDLPIKNKGKEAAFLGEKDKREVLDTYYRAMEVFLKAGKARHADSGIHQFLLSRLEKALNMDNGLKSSEYRHNSRARTASE